MKKPNILFVFTDQQRWDTCGCYGQELDITPNLDKLAAEGTRFEYAFTPQPLCTPARAVLMTGRWGTQNGCWRNRIALPEDTKTIAHHFRGAGYETAYVGKWHLAGDDYRTIATPPERRGGWEDYWVAADTLEYTSHGYDGFMFDAEMNKREFKGYRVDGVTDFALDYLKQRDKEKPFFLFISHIEPHHQNDRNRYEGPDGSKERFKDFTPPGDLKKGEGDWEESYPDYLGCCRSLDDNLGRLVAELKEQGVYDDTLIVYTSDHGSHFRTRRGEYKRACHEGCVRVPMIMRGPGPGAQGTVKEFASLIDLPPTLLKAAGIEVPAEMGGVPLQDVISGKVKREDVFIQISCSHVGRCVRTKKWKYSVCAPGKGGNEFKDSDVYVEEFLYDLENDYHEQNNLVEDASLKDVRAELAELLKKRMSEAGETPPQIKPCGGAEH
jgi:arylsulfatase A-like enzyme